MNKRPVSPRLRRWFTILGYTLIALSLAYALAYGSNAHPIGMVFSLVPIYAGIAFTVTSIVSYASSRPCWRVDLLRIGLWTTFASGFAVSGMANAYYRTYWPQYAPAASSIGTGVSGLAICGVVASMFLWPIPKPHPKGHCQKCGYDLSGSPAGTCPECGQDQSASQA